jgi:hypothetical protein
MIFLGSKARPARKADNLAVILKMWDPQRLTTLWAFTASYRDSFTLLLHNSLLDFILLNTLFSNTLSLCSSLNIRDQVSHPYRTTGKIIVEI